MANTKTLYVMQNSYKRSIIYFNLASDGSQETNLVIYNSGTTHTAIGDADNKTSTILAIRAVSNSAAGKVSLLWDATTPVQALAVPNNGNNAVFDFTDIGGLPNRGGAGKTGNIVLTTTGLATGESFTIILEVSPN